MEDDAGMMRLLPVGVGLVGAAEGATPLAVTNRYENAELNGVGLAYCMEVLVSPATNRR